jgi:hypothetical protein
MSITFEKTATATVMKVTGANTSSQTVQIVPGSAVREGVINRPGGVEDYGLIVQVRTTEVPR